MNTKLSLVIKQIITKFISNYLIIVVLFSINYFYKYSIYYNILYYIYILYYINNFIINHKYKNITISKLIKKTYFNLKFILLNIKINQSLINLYQIIKQIKLANTKLHQISKIILNIITKYKNIILFINVNYIIFIIIDGLIDSNFSNYMFNKLSKFIYIPMINNIIYKFNLLLNYLLNLEYNYLNSGNGFILTNIKYIILFSLINFSFYFIVCLYFYLKLNSEYLLNNTFIKISLKKFNLFKIILNIFIFIIYLFSLYLNDDCFSFKLFCFVFINLELLDLHWNCVDFVDFNGIFKKRNYYDNFKNLMNLDEEESIDIDNDENIKSLDKNYNGTTLSEDIILEKEYINFKNFNELSIEEKRSYIIQIYENKGLTPTFYTINWLTEKVILNTNGNQIEVDIFLNNYLNQILNLERDTLLQSKAFHRNKPFLRHLVFKTPLEYPYVIPAKNTMNDFEEYQLKDNLIKNED